LDIFIRRSDARATKFNPVTRDILGKCPRCMLNIDAPELEHIVLDYTGYTLQREKHLESILGEIPAMDLPTQTLQVLLGGKGQTVGGGSFSMGHSWSGDDAQGLRDTGRPGFVPVAMFLGMVCPSQMGLRWKWNVVVGGCPSIPIWGYLRKSWDIVASDRSYTWPVVENSLSRCNLWVYIIYFPSRQERLYPSSQVK
jgi:hypothetical protein